MTNILFEYRNSGGGGVGGGRRKESPPLDPPSTPLVDNLSLSNTWAHFEYYGTLGVRVLSRISAVISHYGWRGLELHIMKGVLLSAYLLATKEVSQYRLETFGKEMQGIFWTFCKRIRWSFISPGRVNAHSRVSWFKL